MTAPNHAAALAPIERDEDMDRTYIPLPGGWEIQTKGNGSSFRIADTKRDNRYAVFDTTIHEALVQMAHDIRAAHETALGAVADKLGEGK